MAHMLAARWVLVAVVTLALVAAGVLAWSRTGSDGPTQPVLATRTVQVGEVEVAMTPLTLDRSGAVFQVELDTHTIELDLDPAASARLSVDGRTVGGASWDGPGPGGHHRAGTLRFPAPVPAGASVELRITGLPGDAAASWTAP